MAMIFYAAVYSVQGGPWKRTNKQLLFSTTTA
jgi:hypothetical protein